MSNEINEDLSPKEFCKKYHYTVEEVIAMSHEELVDKIIRPSNFPAGTAVAMGLFDNYKEGTPISKLPKNLAYLYSFIPYRVNPRVRHYLTKALC